MLLHGFLHTFTGNHRYLFVKSIQPVWILMCILTTQGIAQVSKSGEYKAVFNKPCTEIMTLSSHVPSLTQFTLCTYMKLESSNPWTAFTYKLPSSPSNVYEIGLLGDSSSIKIWMFGTPINVLKSLKLQTWYEMCIKWSVKTENMAFYIDGSLEEEQKLEKSTKLQEGGSVVLGCSYLEESNSTIPVGLEGELHMFRMWKTDEVSFSQKCIDGNVIKWDIGNWIYSPAVMQQDLNLPCATQQPENPTNIPDNNSTSPTKMPFTASNTTDVSDISNNSMTTVNTYVSTDYASSTTANMTCVSNASIDVQKLYAEICNSTFPCNGTVYEIILQGNCTGPIQEFRKSTLFTNYKIYVTDFLDGCRVLVNNSTIICDVQKYFVLYNLYLQEKNAIDYCCCDECYQSTCFDNHTFTCEEIGTTSGHQTTGYRNSFSSSDKSTSNGLSTISNNLTITTVNNQPVSPNKNAANTTILHTGTVSMSSADSNTTVNSGTTLVISSNSRTTFNRGSSTSFNRTSSATDTREPTTSLSSESSTTHRRTDFTTTYFSEFSTSSSTTNQSSSSTSHSSSNANEASSSTSQSSSTTNEASSSTSQKSRTPNQASTSTPSHSSSTTNQSSSTTNQSSIFTSPSFSDTSHSFSDTTKPIDIDHLVSTLEELLVGEVNVTGAKMMLEILDSILNSPHTLANVSTRLIKIVDKIGLKLNFLGQSIDLTSQYLALAVSKVNASSFTGTSFGVDSSSGLQVTLGSQLPENSTGSVLLPASLLNDLSATDKDIASRVQFNYFAKTSFFVDSSLSINQSLVSNVISSSVANLTVTNLKQNVTVTLKTSPLNESGVLKCVFWDFTKNSGNGGWSSEGCTVDSTTQNNNKQTVCKCNHLTSFGILLDMTPNNQISPEDKLILTFITYIGCGLSAIFLSVTLVTYIAFEKIRRDYPSKILIQLCAALIGLNLTFLMDPWIALYSEIPGLCISVAAFLHYFLLVSITWMGLEAFHMYLSLVKVFNTYVRKYILKFCIIGWGAPAVVVAIILAVNKDLYELQISEPYPNGAKDYFCWMKDIIYWITVVGYFCVIFLLNVGMFVVVLIQLCRIKKQKQLGYQRKTFLQDVRSVAGITFLLGITWGLGFFSFGPGKTVVQYLFTIFNSLQGFFIFFFYCVAKENVRKQWRRYLCCGKFRLAENSDWSKTATNKLKNQTSKQGISSNSSNSIQSTSNSNSTTLLVSNEYSMHPNGNGNVFKERNGVAFMPQNGEVQLQEIPGRPPTRNGDTQRTSLRRTSNRGSVHFVDQI